MCTDLLLNGWELCELMSAPHSPVGEECGEHLSSHRYEPSRRRSRHSPRAPQKDPERAHGEWVPRARAVGAVTGGAGLMAELDQVPLWPRGGRWGERRASDGADGR